MSFDGIDDGDDVESLPSLYELTAQVRQLQETVDSQQARIDELERDVAFYERSIETVEEVINVDGDMSVAHAMAKEHGGLAPWLDDLGNQSSEEAVSETTAAVRGRAHEIHVTWMDVRDGREENVKSDNWRRGARLFARFIQKATGEPDAGVERFHGRYRMKGERARQILEAEDDMPATGKSNTVRRAMTFVQKGTRREDCDCGSLDKCAHGLVVFNRDDGYTLSADIEAFDEYVRTVGQIITGDAPVAADDSVSPETGQDEAAAGTDLEREVKDEFDKLASARKNESAYGVVSSSSERLSVDTNRSTDNPSDSR